MKMARAFVGVFSLVLLGACGGGGGSTSPSVTPAPAPAPSPAPLSATTLSYQDPEASGFRLVRNASASTGSHLVLDLIGPAGTQAKGLAFFLAVDGSKASWAHPSGTPGSCMAPGTVFPLGAAPRLVADRVDGDQLQVGLFQKGGSATTLGAEPILSLALDLKGSPAAGAVSLGPASERPSILLNADGTQSPITLHVGSLSAQ